jgi:starch synthase
MYADYITTNSPTYAEEILKDSDYSDGLNKVLAEKSDKFAGILLGLDGYHFNPKHDAEIAKKLTDDTLQFKNENKKQLCKDIGLPFQINVPLVGMVSRINDHKGIPLLIDAADKLMKENVNVVVLGKGDSDLKKKLNQIATKYPQKFIYIDEYNEKLAHQIYAGSDLFLSPGSHTPSGISTMFALNMASIPVVVATGAHQDFMINFNTKTKKGNGFVLSESNSNDFLKQMKIALVLFNDREMWNSLMENALATDLTWTKSVRKYDEIYKNVFKES